MVSDYQEAHSIILLPVLVSEGEYDPQMSWMGRERAAVGVNPRGNLRAQGVVLFVEKLHHNKSESCISFHIS